MAHTRRPYTLLGLLGVIVLCVSVLAIERETSSASVVQHYWYPPNMKQLMAAGLTGRPAPKSPSLPVAIDMVLVDTTQTTVVFHLPQAGQIGSNHSIPSIVLSDNRGRTYRPGVATLSTGPVVPPGAHGIGELVWRVAAYLTGHVSASGYATFAPLSPRVTAAYLRIALDGSSEVVRVSLHLTALRTLLRTVWLHRTARKNGIVVRLIRISRGPGSAELTYTVDDYVTFRQNPMMQAAIVDRHGHTLFPTGGSGSCSLSTRAAVHAQAHMHMHCDNSYVFTSPVKGTQLRLTIALSPSSSRSVVPGSFVSVPFQLP